MIAKEQNCELDEASEGYIIDESCKCEMLKGRLESSALSARLDPQAGPCPYLHGGHEPSNRFIPHVRSGFQ